MLSLTVAGQIILWASLAIAFLSILYFIWYNKCHKDEPVWKCIYIIMWIALVCTILYWLVLLFTWWIFRDWHWDAEGWI